MPRRPFVILDRDGTIIEERHYLSDPGQVVLLPGAAKGLAKMRRLGLGLAVVTNQSGIARGYFDHQRLAQVNGRMTELLAGQGVSLDGIYYCPHHPDQGCACRKPATGLIEQASAELGFDQKSCFVIGDKPCDIDMGRAAGAITFLVRTGYGREYQKTCRADHVCDDLLQAAGIIQSLLEDWCGQGAKRRAAPQAGPLPMAVQA